MIHRVLAAHEIGAALRAPTFQLYAGAFVVLSALVAYAGLAAGGPLGASGFGPTAASLAGLDGLVVSLLGLVAGALALARDRERGTLAYLLAQPVTPTELFLAKFAGVAVALSVALCAGFAAAFAVVAAFGAGGDVAGMLAFAAETWLLAMASAALGVLISALVDRTPVALGAAVLLWLAFVVLGDLGVMATAVATRLGTGGLLAATLANPLDAYKIASIAALAGSVDVLGPGGRLATDLFGAWLMPVLSALVAAWGALALLAARAVFRSRDAI